MLSYRSAFDGKPHNGNLMLTRGKTRRSIKLPGLTIEVIPGPGPRLASPTNDIAYGSFYLASDPRRYLENLTRGRGWSSRVLPPQSIEAALDRILMVGGKQRINQLRDQAREVATELGYEEQFKRLDSIVGALLGTQESKHLSAKQALARAAGRPYDPARLQLFDALFALLHTAPLPDIPDPATSGTDRENFAFFEAYFSNYIEGTTFTVEEAEGGRRVQYGNSGIAGNN